MRSLTTVRCVSVLILALVLVLFTYPHLSTSAAQSAVPVPLLDPCSPNLYGIDANNDTLVTIDPATGQASVVGSLGIDVGNTGLDFDHNGRLWAISRVGAEDWLLRIDRTSGKATKVSKLSQVLGGRSMAFGPTNDWAYATNGTTSDLVRIDIPTGVVTVLHPQINLSTITRTPSGYFVKDGADIRRFNPITGTKGAPVVLGLPAGAGNGSTFGPDGALYFSDGVQLVHIEPNLGEFAVVGLHQIPFINVAGMAFGPLRVCSQFVRLGI